MTPDEADAADPSAGPTILLVDDERDILSALERAIARNMPGARVLSTNEPARAVTLLRSQPIDVIVSDHRMPGMEGVDLLIEARRRAPAAARIMMTGHATERLLHRNVNEARIRHFFAKPYSTAEMVRVLRAITDEQAAAATRAREMATRMASAAAERAGRTPDET